MNLRLSCVGTILLARLTQLSLAVALSFCSTAHADQRSQTIGFDWRNTPDWRAAVDSGWAAVCISPRAQTRRGGWAADSLKAHGVKVYFGIQPWCHQWQGNPILDWQPDSALWAICAKDSLWLRDSTGAVVNAKGWDIGDAYVPDFTNPFVAHAWGRVLAAHYPKADGWYLDYGDLDGCWLFPRVTCATMRVWNTGYKGVARMTRGDNPSSQVSCWCRPMDAKTCEIWPYESVGPYYYNLYSYERVLTDCRAMRRLGGRGLVMCQRIDVPQYRRVTAGVALLTDAWFHWRHLSATNRSYRDPEHFELDLGAASDTCWEREPQVWQRMWTRGFVVANVSTVKTFTYQRNRTVSYVIPPGDALVVQTRARDGRYIQWVTNYGR